MKTSEEKGNGSYITIEYIDFCIDTIRAIDAIIAKRKDRNFILTHEDVNYLKFASNCVRECIYEALLTKNKE